MNRVSARAAVSFAVKKGRLERTPCVVCGETRVDGHHIDYSKPLEVVWLCRQHHVEAHQRMTPLSKGKKEINYLLRDIDPVLWGVVKCAAEEKGMTIRQFIFRALRLALARQS